MCEGGNTMSAVPEATPTICVCAYLMPSKVFDKVYPGVVEPN